MRNVSFYYQRVLMIYFENDLYFIYYSVSTKFYVLYPEDMLEMNQLAQANNIPNVQSTVRVCCFVIPGLPHSGAGESGFDCLTFS